MERSEAATEWGDVKISDSMIKDGLWDPYGDKHMGNCAEMCAEKYTFTREAQDAFALRILQGAQGAMEAGEFEAELASGSVPQRKGDPIVVDKDEEPLARHSTRWASFAQHSIKTELSLRPMHRRLTTVQLQWY